MATGHKSTARSIKKIVSPKGVYAAALSAAFANWVSFIVIFAF
jgi:hypothetical protein